jgi:hypothetical protein
LPPKMLDNLKTKALRKGALGVSYEGRALILISYTLPLLKSGKHTSFESEEKRFTIIKRSW